jgi:hypothetical protein
VIGETDRGHQLLSEGAASELLLKDGCRLLLGGARATSGGDEAVAGISCLVLLPESLGASVIVGLGDGI